MSKTGRKREKRNNMEEKEEKGEIIEKREDNFKKGGEKEKKGGKETRGRIGIGGKGNGKQQKDDVWEAFQIGQCNLINLDKVK